jgi:hypothetical protein
MNRDDLAREYAREEAELMDTYRAHEDSFKAGWDACARNGNPTPLPEEAEKEARELELDCGDNSCLFAKSKGGMRTNGGCSCYEKHGFHRSAVLAAKQMLPEIIRLRREAGRASVKASPSQAAPRGDCEYTMESLIEGKDDEIAALKQEVAGGSWAYVKQIDDLKAELSEHQRQSGMLKALCLGAEEERDRLKAEKEALSEEFRKYRNEYGKGFNQLIKLESELTTLRARAEKMAGEMEFYAREESWFRLESTNSIISDTDLYKPKEKLYRGQMYGGKRARAALEAWRKPAQPGKEGGGDAR